MSTDFDTVDSMDNGGMALSPTTPLTPCTSPGFHTQGQFPWQLDKSSMVLVGKGNFCAVWKAHVVQKNGPLSKPPNDDVPSVVAFKAPLSSKANSQEILHHEGELLGLLQSLTLSRSSTGIVRSFGAYENGLVLNYYPMNLQHYISLLHHDDPEKHIVTLNQWRLWAIKLLEAVCLLHSCGIIHADLKPDNILLSDDLEPIIADFSSAYTVLNHDLAPEGGPEGGASAAEFTAPEVLHSTDSANESSDIFSLGLIMLYVVTGERPYHKAKNFIQLLTWAQSGLVLDVISSEDQMRLAPVRPILEDWLVRRVSPSELLKKLGEMDGAE